MDSRKKKSDRERLDRFVGSVRFRMLLFTLSRTSCRFALVASAPAFILLAASRFAWLPFAPAAASAILCASLVAAIVFSRRPTAHHAAVFADRKLGLSELLATAWETGDGDPGAALLRSRAVARISRFRPSYVSRFGLPPEVLGLAAAALVIAAFSALTDAAAPRRGAAAIEAENRSRKAGELEELAARIEERFGGESALVAGELRAMARKLENPEEPQTAAGAAIAQAAEAWSDEASELSDRERARTNAVSSAIPAGEGGGFDMPGTDAQKAAARAALAGLLSDPGASAAHGAAARGAIEALDAGSAPAFSRNMAVIRADLERTRRARMAIEAALRKAGETAESLGTPTDPSGSAPGVAKRADPDGGAGPDKTRGGAARSAAVGWHEGEQAWSPAYDEVVKRYFGNWEPRR